MRGNKFDLDTLNQYTRSEHIKIHAIEYTKGEDTNQILKDVGKYCGVDIKDSDISVDIDMFDWQWKFPLSFTLMVQKRQGLILKH